MFTSMFWLNFAGGTAFVLLGATAVVMIGVLLSAPRTPCDRHKLSAPRQSFANDASPGKRRFLLLSMDAELSVAIYPAKSHLRRITDNQGWASVAERQEPSRP